MEVVNKYEENGYLITKYSNGVVTKNLISDMEIDTNPEINIENKVNISQQEIVNAQILNKLDYLECLTELNEMKGGNL